MNKLVMQDISTNTTQINIFIFLAIIFVILFLSPPLNTYYKTSLCIKLCSVLFLLYSMFLISKQISLIKQSLSNSDNDEHHSYINSSVWSNYLLIVFLFVLLYLIVKSCFSYTVLTPV